jgi:sirohydrochlorin cobaltochelatase
MKSIVVLAMHGAPPNDFPKQRLGEFFGLHGRLEFAHGPELEAMQRRYHELEAQVRTWPRTPANDPFHAASLELADRLSEAVGCQVVVGFGEFCAPSLDQALDEAVTRGAESITVVTPMMTRGGEHSEVDIPAAIGRAQRRHPAALIRYVWPFEPADVAHFLAAEIKKHM